VGLDQLLRALERQAAEGRTAELEAARAEAARIDREGVEDLARRTQSRLDEQEIELRAGAERAIAAARRGHRQRVLEARERLLERIFARAREIVNAEQSESSRAELLAEEIRRAGVYLGDIPAVTRCAPAMVEPLRARLGDRNGMRVEPDPSLRAGFRMGAADGSVIVDHTPEQRLAALRSRLAIELVRRIEPAS
jgi:vacuolar-type H+-ATPase subunit E/Vma4